MSTLFPKPSTVFCPEPTPFGAKPAQDARLRRRNGSYDLYMANCTFYRKVESLSKCIGNRFYLFGDPYGLIQVQIF